MKQTPLHALHLALNAKMAEFAGYDMPIQYPAGVMAEHNHTREKAGLFDVSHMGQVTLEGPGVVELLEKLTPSSFAAMKDNVAKYTVLTNEDGGMVDDLIVTRRGPEKFFLVINAGCKDKDIAWIKQHLPSTVKLTQHEDRALVALQGPQSETVLREALDIDASNLGYMRLLDHGPCFISRLGYTGEDGFEISVPVSDAVVLWNKLTAHADVLPVGLAARDSLRLEMGYPLYGHDIDVSTSPIEADISWIMKDNTGFIGSARVLSEKQNGASRKRVGVKLTAPGIARENTELFDEQGRKVGILTSGGFSPTLQAAIGQGYIDAAYAKIGNKVLARVRGRDIPAEIAALPFVTPKTRAAKKQAA